MIVEAFYEGKFGVIDPIYGYCFYEGEPLDAYTLMCERLYPNAIEHCPQRQMAHG